MARLKNRPEIGNSFIKYSSTSSNMGPLHGKRLLSSVPEAGFSFYLSVPVFPPEAGGRISSCDCRRTGTGKGDLAGVP